MQAWPIYVYAPLATKTKPLPQGPRRPVGQAPVWQTQVWQTPVWQTWARTTDRWDRRPGLVFFRRRPRLAAGFAKAGVPAPTEVRVLTSPAAQAANASPAAKAAAREDFMAPVR